MIQSYHHRRLEIRELIPTHNRLRDISRLSSIQHNTFAPPFISLANDKCFVHDGHHRLVCMLSRGQKWLDEYHLEEYSYEDYNDINFDKGYVTPFDLHTECRLPDFYKFKEVIMRLYNTDSWNIDELENLIINKHKYYTETRYIHTMGQLYESVKFAL